MQKLWFQLSFEQRSSQGNGAVATKVYAAKFDTQRVQVEVHTISNCFRTNAVAYKSI